MPVAGMYTTTLTVVDADDESSVVRATTLISAVRKPGLGTMQPKQITATVIGLYYLGFFAANKMVGYVGGLYSSLPTTTFWLIHIASAAFGLVAFVVFKLVLGKRMSGTGARER